MSEYLVVDRPTTYRGRHSPPETALEAAIAATVGSGRAVQIKPKGTAQNTRGRLQNRFKRLHPHLRVVVKVVNGQWYTWAEPKSAQPALELEEQNTAAEADEHALAH